ncbi:MAG TPA: glycosyltransferase [Terracidiphilus sp.]|nr:glycosyltransferase [Terracidiphilus sp.]
MGPQAFARYTRPMRPASIPVSVVVTELNEIEDIGRVVSSLLAQIPPPAEVVVVDGGSTDGTWEWLLEARQKYPRLVAIRDETCSLKFSKGPVSRGRNVAIAAAQSAIIACADAGCTYAPDWLANLTAPLAAGAAEYALGGTCLDPGEHTVWDVASAPFFSIKLSPLEPTKSCTARSMAFTKALWERIGGFPEDVLVGEDTLFDLAARRQIKPAFIANAKALYRPMNSFRSAAHQMARYAISDGQAGVRWARLLRNAARCLLQAAALVSLAWPTPRSGPWPWIPFAAVFALECWYAFHRDWRFLPQFGIRSTLARFAFSVAVPWIVAVNQIRGRFSAKPLTNRQNVAS